MVPAPASSSAVSRAVRPTRPPPRRVEAADAVEIRPQHADGEVEERLEIRLPDRAQGEARAHVIAAQNFWIRVQASRSASSEVA